jgi:hypothetical protein
MKEWIQLEVELEFEEKMELLYAMCRGSNRELAIKVLRDANVMDWIVKNANKVGNYNYKGGVK